MIDVGTKLRQSATDYGWKVALRSLSYSPGPGWRYARRAAFCALW